MTTLHVREDQLRAAVAEFPSVAGSDADAKFPHKLTIEVRERAPVAAIESGARPRRRRRRRARPARPQGLRPPDPARPHARPPASA